MSLISHAYKRLCKLARLVIQRTRVLNWLSERGIRPDGMDTTPEFERVPVIETCEPRLFLSGLEDPILSINGPSCVAAGSNYVLTLDYDDTEGDEPLDYWVIDWGDGTVVSVPGTSGSHVYSNPSPYFIITATAYNIHNEPYMTSLVTTVTSVPPTLRFTGDGQVDEGGVYRLYLFSEGLGADTITDWTIDWGDGQTTVVYGNPPFVEHIYPDGPNTFTISASARNEDGVFTAQSFGYDSTFGDGGMVVMRETFHTIGQALVVEDNGTILVGIAGLSATQFRFARYQSDGTLDPTFGNGGMAIVDMVPSGTETLVAVLRQSDGKYIGVGTANNQIALTRLNADGTIDTTFGTAGKVVTNIGATISVKDAILQPDGKIVVVGNAGSAIVVTRYNANGSVDTTFGTSGRTTTTVAGGSSAAYDMALQPDGKILISGKCPTGLAVFRYTTTGVLDSTFGSNGMAVIPATSSIASFDSLAVCDDGKIIAVGSIFDLNNYTINPLIVRFTANGTLDGSFGSGGIVTFAQNPCMFLSSVILRDDGTIFCSGSNSGEGQVFLQLTADGMIDPSFGQEGVWRPRDNRFEFNSLVILDDGSILGTGFSLDFNSPYQAMCLARLSFYDTNEVFVTNVAPTLAVQGAALSVPEGSLYTLQLSATSPGQAPILSWTINWGDGCIEIFQGNPASVQHLYPNGPDVYNILASATDANGTYPANALDFDPLFGTNGFVQTPVVDDYATILSLLALPDNSILTIGYREDYKLTIVKYLSTGALDEQFGDNGIVLSDIEAWWITSAILHDGSFVIAFDEYIYRFMSDGSLDTTFGNGGQVTVNFYVSSIAIDSEDRIVVVDSDSIALTRYSSAGILDTTFGDSGVKEYSSVMPVFWIDGVYIQNDGKILLVGTSFSDTEFVTIRVMPNGDLDPTFGLSGISTVSATGSGGYAFCTAIAIQPDGKIVLGGFAYDGWGQGIVMRLNADGTLDSHFGTSGKQFVDECVEGIVILVGGDIVVLSESAYAETFYRLKSDGSIMNTIYVDSLIDRWETRWPIAIGADQRIVIGGAYRDPMDTDGMSVIVGVKKFGYVSVTGVAPQELSVSGVVTSVEGAAVTLTGAATHPGNEVLTYAWSVTKDGLPFALPSGIPIDGTTFTFTPTADGLYVVRMTVTDSSGESSTLDHALAVTISAPTNVTVQAIPGTQNVLVQWDAVPNANGYILQRSRSAYFDDELFSVDVSGLSCTDTVAPGTTLYYRVIAKGSSPECNSQSLMSVDLYRPIETPTIASLGLANALGGDITSVPTISGQVAFWGSLDRLLIQFDATGNGLVDGAVFTSGDGTGSFVIDLAPWVSTGPVNVRVRAAYFDATTGGYVYGEWSPFSFTLTEPQSWADPSIHVPRRGEVLLPLGEWLPELDGADGRSACTLTVNTVFAGVFDSFANRFSLVGSTYSTYTLDDDLTPTVTYGSELELGYTYVSSVIYTCEYLVNAVLNPDSSWTYNEEMTYDWVRTIQYYGLDGSYWQTTQWYSGYYWIDANYDGVDETTYEAEQGATQDVHYNWQDTTSGPPQYVYSHRIEETFLLTAEGTQTLAGGLQIEETILYMLSGSADIDYAGGGQDGATAWTDNGGQDDSWYYYVAVVPEVSVGWHSNYFGHYYSARSSVSNRTTALNESTSTTTLTGTDVTDFSQDAGFKRDWTGQTITTLSGSSVGWNTVTYVEEATDIREDSSDRKVVINDQTVPGYSYKSTSLLDTDSYRERDYYARNVGKTTLSDGVPTTFNLEAEGHNKLSSEWSSEETVDAKTIDTMQAGTSLTSTIHRWGLESGTEDYSVVSKGTRSWTPQGETTEGSTTTIQERTGEREWDNTDYSETNNKQTSSSNGIAQTATSTGKADASDKGSGSFTAYSKGIITLLTNGTELTSGVTNHSGSTTAERASSSTYDSTVVRTDTTRSNITVTITGTAHMETLSESVVTTESKGASTTVNGAYTSSEVMTETEEGTRSERWSEVNTSKIEDTNTTGNTTNATGTSKAERKSNTKFDALMEVGSNVSNGLTASYANSAENESGTLYDYSFVEEKATVVDSSTKGVVTTTVSETLETSKLPNGTYSRSESSKSQTNADGSYEASTSLTEVIDSDTSVYSESHVKVTSDDKRTDIVSHSETTVDRTYDGEGTYHSKSTTVSQTGKDGSYTMQSISDTYQDTAGTSTLATISETTSWGTISETNYTRTQGTAMTPDRAYSKDVREGDSSVIYATHRETDIAAGKVSTSSWSDYKTFDTGTSEWEQSLNTVTDVTDTRVANLSVTQHETHAVQASGDGSYTTWRRDWVINYTDGTYETLAAGSDYVEYTSKQTTDTTTKVDSKDERTPGVVQTVNTTLAVHEEGNNEGDDWTQYTYSRATDGKLSKTDSYEGNLSGKGTSTSTLHHETAVSTKTSQTNGQHLFKGTSGEIAKADIVRSVVGNETTTTDRNDSSSYTVDESTYRKTTDGKLTSEDHYTRTDTGSFTSTTTTSGKMTATDHAMGGVVSASVTASYGSESKITDGKIKQTVTTNSTQNADGTQSGASKSTYDESATMTSSSWSKRDGSSTFLLSQQTGDYITSDETYNTTDQSTATVTTHLTDSTNQANGKTTSTREESEIVNRTNITSTINSSANLSSYSTTSSGTVSHDVSADQKSTYSYAVTNGKAYSKEESTRSVDANGKTTLTSYSEQSHYSPFTEESYAKTTASKTVVTSANKNENWQSETTHGKSMNGTDSASIVISQTDKSTTHDEETSYKITGTYTDSTSNTYTLKHHNQSTTAELGDRIGSLDVTSKQTVTDATSGEFGYTLTVSYTNTSVTGKAAVWDRTFNEFAYTKVTSSSSEMEQMNASGKGTMDEPGQGTPFRGQYAYSETIQKYSATSVQTTSERTTTTTSTESNTGWAKTVTENFKDSGTSTWTVDNHGVVNGYLGKLEDTSNVPDYKIAITEIFTDNGSSEFSVTGNWTTKTNDKGLNQTDGKSTSHIEASGTSVESRKIRQQEKYSSTGDPNSKDWSAVYVGETDWKEIETAYSTNGTTTQERTSGVETWSGSVKSTVNEKRIDDTVNTVTNARSQYGTMMNPPFSLAQETWSESLSWGNVNEVETDTTITSTLASDGTSSDKTTTTKTTGTSQVWSTELRYDAKGDDVSGYGPLLWEGPFTIHEVATEEYRVGTYTTDKGGKGDRKFYAFDHTFVFDCTHWMSPTKHFDGHSSIKAVADRPSNQANFTVTVEASSSPFWWWTGTEAVMGTASMSMTFEQAPTANGLLAYIVGQPQINYISPEYYYSPTIPTTPDMVMSAVYGWSMSVGYVSVSSCYSSSPTWEATLAGYVPVPSGGYNFSAWLFNVSGIDLLVIEREVIAIGQAVVDGDFTQLLYHLDGMNLLETLRKAGVIDQSTVTAIEIFVDGTAGFIDGFLATINPFEKWIQVPKIGVIYGHETAYTVGTYVGMVGGVAAAVLVGNLAAGACGVAAVAAKAYTFTDTVAGMVGAAQNIYSSGDVGVMDVLAFAPAIGFGVQRLRGISNQCFLEDTAVLAGTADGEMVSRNIQDIQVGDRVWTRSSDNPDAPLELREVTAVYRNVTYSVQRLTVADEMGNIDQISVTPDHEFYSASRNAWVRVADLVEGEWLVSADGCSIQVLTNVAEACPEGLVTYNMQVAGAHTYFVADGLGQESWTWVHNMCALRDNLGPKPGPGYQAAHLIPQGAFSNRRYEVREAIRYTQKMFNDILSPKLRNEAINGFWATAGHNGTHTNRYFLFVETMFKKTETTFENIKGITEAIKKGKLTDVMTELQSMARGPKPPWI